MRVPRWQQFVFLVIAGSVVISVIDGAWLLNAMTAAVSLGAFYCGRLSR